MKTIFGFSAGLNLRIFILSVLILFLELFLIRWISTEIRIFAYFNNLVLLACFIGLGLGCYFFERKLNPLLTWVFLAILILMVRMPLFIGITVLFGGFYNSNMLGIVLDKNIFIVLEGIVLTIFMFSVISCVFFPLGQLLGSMFNSHKNTIFAYSLNIFGNIVGIWLFSFLSFIYSPPWIWFIFSACLGLIFLNNENKRSIIIFSFFFTLSLLMLRSFFNNTLWTPYQKLQVYRSAYKNGYNVLVNNVHYMGLYDISEGFVNRYFNDFEKVRRMNQYEIPYLLKKDIKDVLIVGSGGGNDVAAALRNNVKTVDAVEIDPGIYKLGLMLHPEKPYSDKRVSVFIDDARSFFKKAEKKYDAICFGLLDAHTSSSNYNNVRLDHYVYTRESFREAKNLLKPNGIMTIIFEVKGEWLGYRIYHLLKETFGKEPLIFNIRTPEGLFGWGGVMYVIGFDASGIYSWLDGDMDLKNFIESNKITYRVTPIKDSTDDWPYFYLRNRVIPIPYICIILSLIIIFLIGSKAVLAKAGNINFHFLFLGAAFMLLEFQNITKLSLLFGSTWLVNAYAITAILFLILLANLITHYFDIRNTKLLYFLLSLSLLLIYAIPLDKLNIHNYYFKAIFIMAFLNLPVLFAGIIFINSFKNFPNKNVALGSNILGASLGGLFESVSFITGIKSLILLVIIFYISSFYFGKNTVFFRFKK